MQAFPQPPRNPCTGGMGEEGASNPPCKAPLNHCVPPGHRQRHCIPAGRRQDQGPPEAPPEKSPARHRQNTQTQGIIVSPRGIARDTVSPRGVGRTKAPPKHRQKSPPRGTGRTRKPKAPTKGILEPKHLILRTSSDTQQELHTMAHARVSNHCP